MSTTFDSLNEDCKIEIMKTFMLSEDTKVTTLQRERNELTLRSVRPQHMNRMMLVNKSLRDLWLQTQNRYEVYELCIHGFDFYKDALDWSFVIPYDEIRYLRLMIDCTQPDPDTARRIPTKDEYFANLSEFLKQFPALCDLELQVILHGYQTRRAWEREYGRDASKYFEYSRRVQQIIAPELPIGAFGFSYVGVSRYSYSTEYSYSTQFVTKALLSEKGNQRPSHQSAGDVGRYMRNAKKPDLLDTFAWVRPGWRIDRFWHLYLWFSVKTKDDFAPKTTFLASTARGLLIGYRRLEIIGGRVTLEG